MKIQLGDGNTAVCFEGQRLTQAKTIAARHGRKGGRPRLAADTAGSGSPAASKTGFTEPAQAAGDSESELAREAIDDHLARRSPNPPSATSPTGNAHCVSRWGWGLGRCRYGAGAVESEGRGGA